MTETERQILDLVAQRANIDKQRKECSAVRKGLTEEYKQVSQAIDTLLGQHPEYSALV